MTETISNANTAASTLFLGKNGDWWDFWLIISAIAAAIMATAVGITTAGSLISHKREAALAEETLGQYKLETAKQLAEANARQKEAELKLAQLRKLAGPREINFERLNEALKGQAKAPVVIWYVPEVSDGYWFASRLFSALHSAGWDPSWPQAVPELTKEDVDKVMPDASGRLFSVLRGQPPAMNAGGQPSGVTVVGDGDHTNLEQNAPASAFKALFQALSKSTDFGMYGSGGSQFMPVPKGTLRVVIAAKTDPIFVDTPPVPVQGTNP
ncbi:hypothetical protein [Bradyrhizobium manausense]|uniref:hypothetical protein n=1 Tax=Bradyrhizobium manausense TaxID=989370 RepID=UPI000AEA03F7|nr:hypothetical protein [Bradyrhizobium manausense]